MNKTFYNCLYTLLHFFFFKDIHIFIQQECILQKRSANKVNYVPLNFLVKDFFLKKKKKKK